MFFPPFMLQNVREGMLLLGCVKEVADFEVTVSLPCGLQGFLSIKNICESYTKVLSQQLDSSDVEVKSAESELCEYLAMPSLSSNYLMYSVLSTKECLILKNAFAGNLLTAAPFLSRHGVEVCGCQVGHFQRRFT